MVSTLRLKNVGMALEFASPKLAKPVTETAGLAPIANSQINEVEAEAEAAIEPGGRFRIFIRSPT